MGAHTPAPWVATREGDRWGIYSTKAVGDDRLIVGWVEVSRPGFTHPIDRADAVLMASAPDLLAACEAMVAAAQPTVALIEGDIALKVPSALVEKARAAIARARGVKT